MKKWQKEKYQSYLMEKHGFPEMTLRELAAYDLEFDRKHRRLLRAILGYANTREKSIHEMLKMLR